LTDLYIDESMTPGYQPPGYAEDTGARMDARAEAQGGAPMTRDWE
jgi:hypothetical protein